MEGEGDGFFLEHWNLGELAVIGDGDLPEWKSRIVLHAPGNGWKKAIHEQQFDRVIIAPDSDSATFELLHDAKLIADPACLHIRSSLADPNSGYLYEGRGRELWFGSFRSSFNPGGHSERLSEDAMVVNWLYNEFFHVHEPSSGSEVDGIIADWSVLSTKHKRSNISAALHVGSKRLLLEELGASGSLAPAIAAYAEDISGRSDECLAFALGLYLQQFHNKEVNLTVRGILRPHAATIRRIYSIGFPSIAMTSVGSVMTFCMNQVLLIFSETATAVFGVYFKLQSFVFMPIFGLNNAMVPIISYNYGALHPDRMKATMRLSMALGEGFMLIGFAVFQLLPGALLGFFNASESMLAIGEPALRIISASFLVAGVCVVCGSVFQAVGQGMFSLIVSVARQLLVLVPLAYLFSLSGDLEAVWWSFPAAEVVSLLMTLFFMARVEKTILHPLAQKAREAQA